MPRPISGRAAAALHLKRGSLADTASAIPLNEKLESMKLRSQESEISLRRKWLANALEAQQNEARVLSDLEKVEAVDPLVDEIVDDDLRFAVDRVRSAHSRPHGSMLLMHGCMCIDDARRSAVGGWCVSLHRALLLLVSDGAPLHQTALLLASVPCSKSGAVAHPSISMGEVRAHLAWNQERKAAEVAFDAAASDARRRAQQRGSEREATEASQRDHEAARDAAAERAEKAASEAGERHAKLTVLRAQRASDEAVRARIAAAEHFQLEEAKRAEDERSTREAAALKQAVAAHKAARAAQRAHGEAQRAEAEDRARRARAACVAKGAVNVEVRAERTALAQRSRTAELASAAEAASRAREAAIEGLLAELPYRDRLREIHSEAESGRVLAPTASTAAAQRLSLAYRATLTWRPEAGNGSADADTEDLLQYLEGQRIQQKGLFSWAGYTDTQVTRHPQYRLAQALREARLGTCGAAAAGLADQTRRLAAQGVRGATAATRAMANDADA